MLTFREFLLEGKKESEYQFQFKNEDDAYEFMDELMDKYPEGNFRMDPEDTPEVVFIGTSLSKEAEALAKKLGLRVRIK